jgi:hypothetical protein
MTQFVNIEVKIKGIYPAADIDMVAVAKGCPEGENKLDFCVERATEVATNAIAEWLAEPMAKYIEQQTLNQLEVAKSELGARVAAQLTAEIIKKEIM